MKFDKAIIRILVRKDYGACFDFSTKQMGLLAAYGDRNGPYTSFAVKEGEAPCSAIFFGANMTMFQGYNQPTASAQPDTVVAVIPSEDLDKEYKRLKEAGVQFLAEPQFIEDWEMRCTYFRDPEGNLFELNDGSEV